MLKRPLRLVLISLSQYSSVIEAVDMEVGFMPAQLNIWLILPCFLMMASMKSLQASVEPISKEEIKWSPWAQSESVLESEEPLMSVRARVAPSWESLMLVARPIPEPAPVHRMTLFSNVLDILRDQGTTTEIVVIIENILGE